MERLFLTLAADIFIADGGVDDWREMDNDERRAIVTEQMHNYAHDPIFVDQVVKATRALQEVD